MLYLPPLVAHHGVALDEGMTWSVGFLAPKQEARAAFAISFPPACLFLSRSFPSLRHA